MTDKTPSSHAASNAERREHARNETRLAAKVVLAHGQVSDAFIVDRSLKGMRLRLAKDMFVPKEITIVELAGAIVHEAVVVWKAFPDIGVSLRSSHSVRTSVGADATRIRRIWSDVTSR